MEARTCFWNQSIDNDNGSVGRVRRAHKLGDDKRCVVRGLAIDDVYEGLETTSEAARIWGQRWRLRHCNDRPEELATMSVVSAEKDDPDDLATTTKDLAEEAEETTRQR